MIFEIFICASSIIYAIYTALMDLRERKMYFFPCVILAIAWFVFLSKTATFSLFIFIFIQALLAVTLYYINAWASGDSYFICLFGLIIYYVLGSNDWLLSSWVECVFIIAALLISVFIGWIEIKVKKDIFDVSAEIAVLPGFCIIVTTLLVFKWGIRLCQMS